MVSFKGAHFAKDIILVGVRWYVAYPLSYRHVEELMEARGVAVDHAILQRWVVQYRPPLEEALHRRTQPVWVRWRMDDLHQDQRPVVLPLSRGGHIGPDDRLPADGAPGRARGQAVSDQSDPPSWCAGEEHHRWECGQ